MAKKKKTPDEILGKPKLEGLSENILHIRRNLILFSAILFFINYYSLEITKGNLLGMEINNLNNVVIEQILLIFL